MSLSFRNATLAFVIASAFSSPAFSQVDISAATPVPVIFASELLLPSGGSLTLGNPGGALSLRTALRFSFGPGEVRNARIECPAHVRFDAGSTVVASSAAAVGAINGLGSNVITFSITATNTSTTADSTVTITGTRTISALAPASCTYSLYDTASQAANGGPLGRITTVTGAYLAFARSYNLVLADPHGAIADVNATPPYSRFVSTPPTNNPGVANLGRFDFNAVSALPGGGVQPRLASGEPGTLVELLNERSDMTVAGDFSAVANADGSFTGAALSRVYLSGRADCGSIGFPAVALTATSARFATGSFAVPGANLCFNPRLGATIPASSYTLTFNALPIDEALYSTPSIGPVAFGSITRNGVQLTAPLAQLPTGWLSRIVLNNTGSATTFIATLTPGTGSGTEPSSTFSGALSTQPINLPVGTSVFAFGDLFPAGSFSGAARGTVTITANAPRSSVNGLYQIVNPQSGSISNHVMVAPGTN